jgi:hypothetical protein
MCNCEMVRDGAFVLVAALWAAIFSSTFFGDDFGTLLIQTWHTPGHAPNGLIVWLIVFAIGCIRFGLGVNQALVDGDTASIPASLTGMGAALLALYKGWYPPAEDLGLASHLAWEGFYVAFSAPPSAISGWRFRHGSAAAGCCGRSPRPISLNSRWPVWAPFEPLLGIDNASFHRTLAQLRALAPMERVQLLEQYATAPLAPAKPRHGRWLGGRPGGRPTDEFLLPCWL